MFTHLVPCSVAHFLDLADFRIFGCVGNALKIINTVVSITVWMDTNVNKILKIS